MNSLLSPPRRRIIETGRGIARPSIPIRCPRCRKPIRTRPRPSLRMMAAGDRMLDASGNVILDSSGNVMLSDGLGDACCCSPPTCGACTGTGVVPTQLTLTIAGWSPCTCAVGPCAGFGICLRETIGTINGTYCVSWDGTQWALRGISGITRKSWSGFSCTGTPTTISTTFGITIGCDGNPAFGTPHNTFLMAVFAEIGASVGSTLFTGSVATISSPCPTMSISFTNCLVSGDCNNTGSICGTSVGDVGGYGGTAAATAGC